jgi:hypothetical protein
MAEEFAENVVRRFTGEIASRLTKASALARTAETLNSQSLTGLRRVGGCRNADL